MAIIYKGDGGAGGEVDCRWDIQNPQPPIFCLDICVKFESNHECLSQNKTNKARNSFRDKSMSSTCNPIHDRNAYICPIEAWTVEEVIVSMQWGRVWLVCNMVSWHLKVMKCPIVDLFLCQIDTFCKWLRCLTKVCYVKLTKIRYLDKLNIIWVGWGLRKPYSIFLSMILVVRVRGSIISITR